MFTCDVITLSQLRWEERLRDAERMNQAEREQRFGYGGVRVYGPTPFSRLAAALRRRFGSRQAQRQTSPRLTSAR
jgi:hypothetical protein